MENHQLTKELTQKIIQWDVKSWSRALSYWDRNVNWSEVNTALELGGREGGLSLWLALKGKQVVCSDLQNVKSTAENLHKNYAVDDRIQYQDIDATNIPYTNHFDVIVFKSIIGGIGRNNNSEIQRQVFHQIHKALKPGGRLLFAENLIASPLHRKLRKRFVDWGNSWRYVSLVEMNDFLKDFSSREIKATGVLGSLGRSEVQRNALSTIDQWMLNGVCPDTWKYISYGIAVK